MSTQTIEETFECPDSARLSLSNIRGSVNIQAGEGGKISVVARKQLNTGDEENTIIELSQTNDGTVKVNTRYNHKGFRFFRKWVPCKVDYEVRVPEKCSLKVRGVSNSANIEGINGIHDISSVSGDVKIRGLTGELTLKTVSGDVQGEMLSGPVRLKTVSGDIKLIKSDISKITGKTVSGDMLVETPLGNGPYDFNSVSGDIKLYLPSLRGATVTSSSLSGNIWNSIASSQSNYSRNTHKIEIEGGGVEINHGSVSGDLFLDSENINDPSGNESEEIPSENRSQTRTDILERVDRGEMSVDQALQMIASNSVA
jgi:DUF4097 and DUF4098 domain-containing protein YvlB